jgi:flagellin-like protein
MKFMNKRGVSPLVATILLIAFAIALGAVVMSYGSAYYGSKQVGGEGASTASPIRQCGNVELMLYEINGIPQVCYGGSGAEGYVNFMLDNKGNVDVEELLVTIIGEKGSKEYQLKPFIGKGQLFDKRDKSTKYDFGVNGNIFQIQIRPYIRVDGEIEVCIDKQITLQNIKAC